jgi:hypothetical protein
VAHRDNYGARLRIRKRVHSARSGDAYVKLRIRNDASATDYAVRRRHATLICANARQAAQLLGAAEALREMTGGRNPDERYVTDRVATTLRAQLDPELLE